MKRFGPLLTAVIIFLTVVTAVQTSYVVPFVLSHSARPLSTCGMTNADSLTLQEKAIADSRLLPIYGSSELGYVFLAEHPSVVFKGPESPFLPYLIGAAGNQSLIHCLHFGALDGTVQGKKVVIILSLQWFDDREGISAKNFERWFSRQQIYQTLDNPRLSPGLKASLAARLLQFTAIKIDPVLSLNLYAAAHTNKFLYSLGAWSRYPQQLVLKETDYIYAYRALKNEKPPLGNEHQSTFPAGGNWQLLLQQAEKDGRQSCTNNDYGFTDEYWGEHIGYRYAQLKDSSKSTTYSDSPEYEDVGILVEILKELKMDPLFVIVPDCGPWADYTSVPPKERRAYYQKARDIISRGGFQIADFSDREYEKYFLLDKMHLGWKGWAHIDEAIYRFYMQSTR